MRAFFLIFSLTTLLDNNSFAHAIKISTCVINGVPKENQAKIGMNFFWDDLSICIFKEDQLQTLNSDLSSKQIEAIKKYIKAKLSISINNQSYTIESIHLSNNILHVNALIKKLNYQASKNNLIIENTLMLHKFSSQSNIVRVDLTGKKGYSAFYFNQEKTVVRKTI